MSIQNKSIAQHLTSGNMLKKFRNMKLISDFNVVFIISIKCLGWFPKDKIYKVSVWYSSVIIRLSNKLLNIF